MGTLAYRYRDLMPILQEHLDDNEGELLPHLFLSDVFRWLVANRVSCPEVVQGIFDLLETAYEDAGERDDVRDLIAVSGVEMIPDPGQPGAELRTLMGTRLKSVDPWQAS
ncbi:MAG: hypothetical protein WBA00_14255 [Rhodococcus sp. (in: high G+C Gram-positive bacteria)]